MLSKPEENDLQIVQVRVPGAVRRLCVALSQLFRLRMLSWPPSGAAEVKQIVLRVHGKVLREVL